MFNFAKIYNYFYIVYQKIHELFSDLFSLVYVKIYSGIALFLIVINWIGSYIINLKSSADSIVFLHYNVDFGANLIGEVKKIYIIPLLGLLIFLFNFILSVRFYKYNRFIPHILLSSGVVVNVTLLISIYLIYLINFK